MARRKLNAQEKQERETKRRIAAEDAIKRAQAAQRRARQNEDRNMLLRIREITRSDLNWDMLMVILNHEFAVSVEGHGIAVMPLHMLVTAAFDAEFPAEDTSSDDDSNAAAEQGQTVRQVAEQRIAAPQTVQRSAAGSAQNISPGTPGR